MSDYFFLSSDRAGDDDNRLLSYSGTIRGGKAILTLKIEIKGFFMHQTLSALEGIQSAHNKKPGPKPTAQKRQSKATMLALPPPQRALTGPEKGDF